MYRRKRVSPLSRGHTIHVPTPNYCARHCVKSPIGPRLMPCGVKSLMKWSYPQLLSVSHHRGGRTVQHAPNKATRNSNLSTRNSNLATRNSNLATRNSNMATRNSNMATRNSNLATRNSNMATRNSNLATRNSNLATRNSNLATRNSRLDH